jgi:hypothetical protein
MGASCKLTGVPIGLHDIAQSCKTESEFWRLAREIFPENEYLADWLDSHENWYFDESGKALHPTRPLREWVRTGVE